MQEVFAVGCRVRAKVSMSNGFSSEIKKDDAGTVTKAKPESFVRSVKWDATEKHPEQTLDGVLICDLILEVTTTTDATVDNLSTDDALPA
jgi:hypothetical protein